MNLAALSGLAWLLAGLLPLLGAQRWLHREIQVVFLLLTRQAQVSLVLFSLIFLPGVFLHEVSHFLMARLLGVRTGKFSLIPQALKNGQLRLGYVETAPADFARDALVGLAPLLTGGAFVAYVGMERMHLLPLGEVLLQGQLLAFWRGAAALPGQTDFWLWFYLMFVVSSTMFPSQSDRRAWLPITVMVGTLLVIALVAGMGPWLAANAAPGVNRILEMLSAIFGISLGAHLLLLAPVCGLRLLLSRVTGLAVR